MIHLSLLASLPLVVYMALYSCAMCFYCRRFCCFRNRKLFRWGKRRSIYYSILSNHNTAVLDEMKGFPPSKKSLVLNCIFLVCVVALATMLIFSAVSYHARWRVVVESSDRTLHMVDERVNKLNGLLGLELEQSVTDAFKQIEDAKNDMYVFIDGVSDISQRVHDVLGHLERTYGFIKNSNHQIDFKVKKQVMEMRRDARFKHPPNYNISNLSVDIDEMNDAYMIMRNIHNKIQNDQHSLLMLKVSLNGYIYDYHRKIEDKASSVRDNAHPIMAKVNTYLNTTHSIAGSAFKYINIANRSYLSIVVALSAISLLVALVAFIGMNVQSFQSTQKLSRTKILILLITLLSSLFLAGVATFQLVSYVVFDDLCRVELKRLERGRVSSSLNQVHSISQTTAENESVDLLYLFNRVTTCSGNQTILDALPGISLDQFNVSHITGHMQDALEFFFEKFDIHRAIASYEVKFSQYNQYISRVNLGNGNRRFANVMNHMQMLEQQMKSMVNTEVMERRVQDIKDTVQSIVNNMTLANNDLARIVNSHAQQASQSISGIPKQLYGVKDACEDALHFCNGRMEYLMATVLSCTECAYMGAYYSTIEGSVCQQSKFSLLGVLPSYFMSFLLIVFLLSIPLKVYHLQSDHNRHRLLSEPATSTNGPKRRSSIIYYSSCA